MSGIFAKRNKLFRETVGATVREIDFETSAKRLLFLTANATVGRITGGSEGEELVLLLQQDGTGSRTVTWPASVIWIGGTPPTLATNAYDVDVVRLTKVGDIYIGEAVGNIALAAAL